MNEQVPVAQTNNIEGVLITATDIPATVQQYADKFFELQCKTAASLIEMGRLVLKAQSALKSDGQYKLFCTAIGFKSKSSIRKFEQIGKRADLLQKNADKLPDTWTSLYSIAGLDEDVLEILFDDGKISPAIKGRDIRQLVALHNPAKASSKSGKKFWYKYELPFDVLLEPDEQQALNDIIKEFITQRVKPDDQPESAELAV